ncbi:MAG: hypothetical protein A2X05_18820 [Bacteroidetes bacterium GWE2_41_25]|nr:MAG: hypothetical protein A2X03_12060 [Bacteroidetes bacterium GWA2_40_15]OFX93642.1 MAG: hypothetical protein A2X06_05555 [Bacteroidetes bacterium GWC2_40_22]OFY01630.1 MAG: hypothetical protein A2X05_18820 [Bacteroidetes bacterium GWE2_41_25]OFY60399.1 MAG: hypothetical protein A2X04_17520 [Bacteroidetes bacterium GWF2_41_9]HBQ83254.1 hypothetical protein [Bacteroidales bacterium]
MKKLLFLALIGLNISCSLFRRLSESEAEGSLVTTRKFAGVFIEYRYTVTEDLPKVDVVWIKTTLENRYGKICALSKSCEFNPGDRLYLTRKFYSPGMTGGKWEYFIENDSSIIYKLTEYQSDRKVFTETWY